MRDVIVRGVDGRTNSGMRPYLDGRIQMNGPYPEITNILSLAKLFFKSFISLKHLSDYRTVGLSDRRTIGLSDYSYGPLLRTPLVSLKFLSIRFFIWEVSNWFLKAQILTLVFFCTVFYELKVNKL